MMPPDQTRAKRLDTLWQGLARRHDAVKDRSILSLFDADLGGGAHDHSFGRASDFSARFGDMVLDYSKTNIDFECRALLLALAECAGVDARRDAMFAGEKINETEGRAVLHTALRSDAPVLMVDGVDVLGPVRQTRARMAAFADDLRAGRFVGQGGVIRDVVNIGIGGSDLGSAMATLALAPYHDGPRVHYVSNIDGAHLSDTLRGLDPGTTLAIIASKTFTTIETMTNAETLCAWMRQGGVADPMAQCVAISTAMDRTTAFGIAPERVFGFADWVGGRYSVWGPIGLGLMLAVGPKRFDDFLAGAAAMDAHFRHAPLMQNLPVLLAMVGIWHNQICGYSSRAVLPYDQRLARLPAYLQQLEMESNGKRVAMDGHDLTRHTGPIVWGEPGTNGQHAFYQLIHQGTRVVPCEFLLAANGHEPALAHHHQILVANCLAQSEALMCGRNLAEARAMLMGQGWAPDTLEWQAKHRVFPGNRPSTTLIYPQLTPHMLGQIIALYEHRVFVEGVVLGINSFDQWGVELGKVLAMRLLPVVQGSNDATGHDGSTQMLLGHLSQMAQTAMRNSVD